LKARPRRLDRIRNSPFDSRTIARIASALARDVAPCSRTATGRSAAATSRVTAGNSGDGNDRRKNSAEEETPNNSMSILSGKSGLIVGVANKRSISWAIAQAAAAAGARLALTYPNERLEENVRELAATLEKPPVLPCDVTSDEQIDALASSIDAEFGGLGFLLHGAAFAPKDELNNPFVQTSREGFRIALDVSAYSLIGLTRAMMPLMKKRGGGSVLTLTYLGSQRVFTNYNVMGVAKAALEASVRYLASDLGPDNIRVNAISAGPIKTLAAMGIKDFSSIRDVYKERTPLRRNIELDDVADAAMFLLGPAGRGVTGEILMVDAGFHIMGGA